MLIKIKKNSLIITKKCKIKCAIGKNGTKKNKIEGDKSTPKGLYSLGSLYYRPDRIKNIKTKLPKIKINKKMGWCNLSKNKNYNKQIIIKNKSGFEKLYRLDHKYDALIVINYNIIKTIPNKGSAIFIHLTKNYNPTSGCIALKLKDFILLAQLCNRNTKIKIY